MSDMKLLVEKMKIEEKVMLLGKQNHVERYYSMMDFFLMEMEMILFVLNALRK